MRSIPKTLMLAAVAASTAWLTGCFLGSDDSGPTAQEKTQSDESTVKATGSLETSVARMQDLSNYQYGKEDLSALNQSKSDFAEAARLNPGNSKAQLGLAITEILIAAQDHRLADVINRTVDGKSPFDSRLSEGAPLMRAGVLRKVAAASAMPEFHEIQDSIEKVLLPALDDAIGRIKIAYDDPDFSMTLAIDGEPRELDHAEAGILLAGVHAIHGLVTLWLSYDLDIDYNGSYDYLDALDGIDTVGKFSDLTAAQRDALNKAAEILGPKAPFLAVRPAWKVRLAGVDDEIKQALDILKLSLSSISQENDDQSNDLIHLCANGEMGQCMYSDDYETAKSVIDSARKYMNQPYAVHLDNIDTTLMVDFAAYFNVQDYKKMLPYYGFYDAKDWSDDKPAIYFTDKSGKVTGNIMTVKKILDDAEENDTPPAPVIAQLRAVIHLQDPTFQGFLPGATEDAIWNLLQKQAEYERAHRSDLVIYPAVAKRSTATLRPDFALGLLGK